MPDAHGVKLGHQTPNGIAVRLDFQDDHVLVEDGNGKRWKSYLLIEGSPMPARRLMKLLEV